MNRAAQVYIAGVIAAAVGVFARALMFWHCSKPDAYACYVIVLMAISVLKLRLPRMRGTYSFGSLGGVFGILMFTLPETLIAGCGAVLSGFYYCPHHPDAAIHAYPRLLDKNLVLAYYSSDASAPRAADPSGDAPDRAVPRPSP